MPVPTWKEQVDAAKGFPLQSAIHAMNALVTPCPLPGRVWGFLWRRRQHEWVDYTPLLNTTTYYVLDRCKKCGLLKMGWMG